jgi:hypothetical protein
MGFISDFFLGNHLSKTCALFEEVIRAGLPTMEGVDISRNMFAPFSELSPTRQAQIRFQMPKHIQAFKKHSPERITIELLKNTQVAINYGRERRVFAYQIMLGYLVELGVAIDLNTLRNNRMYI